MNKSDITREQVHDNCVRFVILRLDFSGVMDNKELVTLFNKKFPKAFRNCKYVTIKEVSLTLRKEDFQTISEVVSAPVNIIEKEQIVHYEELAQPKLNGNVTLDISRFYICLTIQYNNCNYDGINKYVEVFKGAITVFKDKVDFFTPRRLGIRKCRVEYFDEVKEVSSRFENFVFNDPNLPIGSLGKSERKYVAYLQDDKHQNIRTNIIRRISPIVKKENGQEKETIGTQLDIDVYYQDVELLKSRNINSLIDDANSFEFEIYKMCMKEEFLIKNNG